ncbi:MAG TPA: glycosyltransferase [Candidatus Acidoferrum sp.]|nr:glycosyltransferase [Candidatus Acidoferrum sp.]
MAEERLQKRPLVSIILATFNEVDHVQKCMTSLLGQEASEFDLEILAVDGISTDGTREYLERTATADPRVRVVLNEKRRAPFAFNLGLSQARGEYVCIFGSHTVYQRDYISICLRELNRRGAVLCGGRVITRPSANTVQARLVASTLGHAFGSSPKSFRTQREGFSDTVNYPVLRKQALIETGGFEESLLRNQDNDIDQKLCARGYKLFHTWKTSCIYYPKAKVKDLLLYGYHNGFWNGLTLQRNADSMSSRHFIPFVFVVSVLLSVLLGLVGAFAHLPNSVVGFISLGVIVGMHLVVGSAAAAQIGFHERFPGAIWLPFVFLAFHLSYGIGTLWALLSRAKPPDSTDQNLATAGV